MKRLLALTFIIFYSSCVVKSSIKSGVLVEPTLITRNLKFALENNTDKELKDIIVKIPNETLEFKKLAPHSKTEWRNVQSSYSYGYIKFKDENEFEYTVQPIDYIGEKLYNNGNMTFIIEEIDSVSKRVKLNHSRN